MKNKTAQQNVTQTAQQNVTQSDSKPVESSKPTYKEIWMIEDRRDGKSFWTRVGTAFENNDGSFTLKLSAMPVMGGRLNMRDPSPFIDKADKAHGNSESNRMAA